jgi:hypothetical protein
MRLRFALPQAGSKKRALTEVPSATELCDYPSLSVSAFSFRHDGAARKNHVPALKLARLVLMEYALPRREGHLTSVAREFTPLCTQHASQHVNLI